MKKVFTIALVSMFMHANAQLSLSRAALGVNFNLGQRVPQKMVDPFFAEALSVESSGFGYNTSLSRVFSDYLVGFNTTKHKYLNWEFNVLQGTDYLNSYRSTFINSGDSSYITSQSSDVSSSLIGIRSLARFSTPKDRRIFLTAGIGLEGLWAYDIDIDGSMRYTERERGTNQANETVVFIPVSDLSNYASCNIMQRVGMGFKLAKNETNFPLNHVYIGVDFQALSNFSVVDANLFRYRSFGAIFSLGYEFQ